MDGGTMKEWKYGTNFIDPTEHGTGLNNLMHTHTCTQTHARTHVHTQAHAHTNTAAGDIVYMEDKSQGTHEGAAQKGGRIERRIV